MRRDRGGGQPLAAQTVDTWVGDYEENKDVLDAMMESLVFGTAATPTPQPTATPAATMLPDAAMSGPSMATGIGLATELLAALVALSGLGLLATRRR